MIVDMVHLLLLAHKRVASEMLAKRTQENRGHCFEEKEKDQKEAMDEDNIERAKCNCQIHKSG